MRRISFLLLILFVFLAPAVLDAQQTPPANYTLLNIRNYPVLKAGDSQVTVQFEVRNEGQTTTTPAIASLVMESTNRQVATADIPPLQQGAGPNLGETYTVTLTFQVSDFPPGIHQSFLANVTMNGVQLATARIGIDFPGTPGASQSAATAPVAGATSSSGIPIAPTAAPSDTTLVPAQPTPIVIFGREIQLPANFDLQALLNPGYIALVIGLCGVGLILLWVFTVILRLLFQKPPSFETWQPPYSAIAFLDPNTPQGRRQAWQQHAQNDAITAPPVEGNFHIRKLLSGMNDDKLTGWRVTAMRVSQYDTYGRVARSQTLLPKGVVKRLDKAVRKSPSLDAQHAEKAVRPVAKALVGTLTKKLNKRNDMLPVSVDIRLKGIHGEVRIAFELFQAQNGQWMPVDRWEPDMTVPSGAIQENYTYAFYGRRPEEKFRAFRKRLEADVTRTLTEMVVKGQTGQPASSPPTPTPPTESSPPVAMPTPMSAPPMAGGSPYEPPVQPDDTAHGLEN